MGLNRTLITDCLIFIQFRAASAERDVFAACIAAQNTTKALILNVNYYRETQNIRLSEMQTLLEHFIDKRSLNKNKSLIVTFKAEIYSIHVK
ncbi:hypothetical protein C3Z09_05155 [Lelliottia aquatilis]|nr:hypothetical protein C3Z09_05155 [Lelliottia aquatilis]